MPTTAQPPSSIDLYRPAQLDLEVLIGELEATGMASHTAIETTIRERGADVLRKVYQGWLDARFVEEKANLALVSAVAGVEVRARRRSLEAEFGRVTVRRHGHKKPGQRAKFPMDEALNLPRRLRPVDLGVCGRPLMRVGRKRLVLWYRCPPASHVVTRDIR